jgi:hypothetical protein
MSTIPDAEPARPWRPEDGPKPTVWTWPTTDRPALRVMSAGKWRYAPVLARQDWPDGTVRYQVEVDLLGDTTVRALTYQWPQPGLRVARRSSAQPSQGITEAWQGKMPRARNPNEDDHPHQ